MQAKICLLLSLIALTNVSYILASNPATKESPNQHLIYSSGAKALVLLDDWNLIETHSLFWEQVRSQLQFELEFKMVDDPSIRLTYFGEYLYNTIIFMAPTYVEDTKRKNEIRIPQILKFLDDHHDIMIFGDKSSGLFLRKLANEFHVDFDDYDSQVKDSLYLYNNKDVLNPELIRQRNNGIIVTKNVINVPAINKQPKNYILYEGIGHEADDTAGYLHTILRADENCYSINTKTGQFYNTGEKIRLVSAYQARNNRRVIISGSVNLCSNRFYTLSSADGTDPINSSNAKYCQDLINWNFQRSGVLKFENIRHHRKADGQSLDTYRIKDEIEYFVDIYEYDYKNKNWKPYITDDIQIEFTMLNPYYILQMKLESMNKPTYFVSFKAPDRWGVFKFLIDYKRAGYSYLDVSTKVPLRPYNHNEYPRFIPQAYPYYLSIFVVFFAFIVFSLTFLFSKARAR